jgi:hypothetical protein
MANMEKRESRRYTVFIDAVIISDGNSYRGVIGNISEKGMYVRIKSAGSGIAFTPGTIFNLEFTSHSEETLNLHCRLTWSYEISSVKLPGKSAYNLGFEITAACPEYMEFYENAAIKKLNEQIDRINNG